MNELFPACYLRKAGESADDGDEDDTDDSDNDNDGDTDAPYVYLRKSQGLRRKFFLEFSDDEVAEMTQVHNFMAFVSIRAQHATMGLPWAYTRASLTLFMLHPWVLNLHKITGHGAVPLSPQNSSGPSGRPTSRVAFRWSNSTGTMIIPTLAGQGSLSTFRRKTTIRPRWAPTSGTQFWTGI